MGDAKDRMKFLVGRAAELVMPSLGREIDDARNTDRAPQLKRAILYSRLQRASRGQNPGAANASIEKTLSAFWKGSPGDQFHEKHAEARIRLFLELHSEVIEALAQQITATGVRFSRLVEIGCGDGKVLSHCMSRLPEIPEAVGLDINAAVIARTAKQYASHPCLSFQATDATEWLMAHPGSGTVLLSNGGVLEYFSPQSFDALLQSISGHPPAAVVLIEPVDPAHDLTVETGSHVFGYESSFSHNHRFRLEQAGFVVTYLHEINHGKVRWMTMIAMRGT